jgi:hypothetical protein
MGAIHQLIMERGRQGVLDLAADKFAPTVVEVAAKALDENYPDIGAVYSGWAQAALPHKKTEGHTWKYQAGNGATLLVQSLVRVREDGEEDQPGIPFGSRARLILYFMQTQAIRHRSREIVLGRSLEDWTERLGISKGGKSNRLVREQCERLAHCDISLTLHGGQKTQMVGQRLVDTAMFERGDDGSRFTGFARLSVGFYEQLLQHPLPLPERAIRALSNNSMALDVYAWLAYRLWRLRDRTPVTWHQLKQQFGQGYKDLPEFIRRFRSVLDHAMAAYPEAEIDEGYGGIILKPSPPPVPRLARVHGHRFPGEAADKSPPDVAKVG